MELMLLILRLPRNFGSPCKSTMVAGLQIRIHVMHIPKITVISGSGFADRVASFLQKYLKSSFIFVRYGNNFELLPRFSG